MERPNTSRAAKSSLRMNVLRALAARNVKATNVTCAGYFLDLPECPIEQVEMENVTITCAPDVQPMAPAMACGVEKVNRKGLVAIYVDKVVMKNVITTGQDGVKLNAKTSVRWRNHCIRKGRRLF